MSSRAATEAAVARYMEGHDWDDGRGYAFLPWLKTCGANVQRLRVKGIDHLTERPQGRWQDGEWVAA